uniref:AlNc14C410G11452 protein n=1 Tax=Albugo laibachii Nc14 TaxID=890382 RepID=F0WEZ6_9STRA|nr:AlNc14C78G5194 [Albugo laibachii Nc14]CCA26759.1 AlNc14C410G11452 [Albugo laibachii Nc14]|eukprot:CCA26759.1 AlNc14C410G11452 [Albugo laibachii Nc14]
MTISDHSRPKPSLHSTYEMEQHLDKLVCVAQRVLESFYSGIIKLPTCKGTGACMHVETAVYPDELYEEIHNTEVSKYQSYVDKKAEKFSKGSALDNLAPDNLYCVKVNVQKDQIAHFIVLVHCMECLGGHGDTFVHSFEVYSGRTSFAFLMIKAKWVDIPWETCENTCYVRNFLQLAECYRDYHVRIDTSPITHQISVYMPESIRQSIKGEIYTECVLAYHSSAWMTECTDCLNSKIGKSASALSDITSLITLKASDRKREVGLNLGQEPNLFRKRERSELDVYPWKNEVVSSYQTSNSGSQNRQSEGLVTVVLATYHGSACLRCLALVHDVLLISTIKRQVWMVKREASIEDLRVCHSCADIKLIRILDILSMRSISAAEVQPYLRNEDITQEAINSLIPRHPIPTENHEMETECEKYMRI